MEARGSEFDLRREHFFLQSQVQGRAHFFLEQNHSVKRHKESYYLLYTPLGFERVFALGY